MHTDHRATTLDIADIVPSDLNARVARPKDDQAMADLAASIRQHGVLQPILVRPADHPLASYEIIAGERRWRAARVAGLTTIPARVAKATDAEALELMITENLQREDLTPVEEARGYMDLVHQGHSVEQVATTVGRSRSYVAARLDLLDLPVAVIEHVTAGRLLPSVAVLLRQVPEASLDAALDAVMGDDWREDRDRSSDPPMTVRQARQFIRDEYVTRLSMAPWALDDATLEPTSGSCAACPKRTSVERDLWGENREGDDNCLDRACWASKVFFYTEAARAAAADANIPVVEGPDAAKDRAASYARGKYVSLDANTFALGNNSTVEKALGKSGLKTLGKVLLIDSNGATTFAVDRKKADKLLREKQEAKREDREEKSPAAHGASATVAARNLERDVREATNARLLARLSKDAAYLDKQPVMIWHVFAELLAEMTSEFWDDEPVITALRRFLDADQINAHHPDSIALLDVNQARGVAVELLAQAEFGHPHKALCELYGLDTELERDAVVREFAARAEAEKAAAGDQPAPAKKKAGKKPRGGAK